MNMNPVNTSSCVYGSESKQKNVDQRENLKQNIVASTWTLFELFESEFCLI